MPPTLTRILWSGLPTAAVLAVLGYLLAVAVEVFLGANAPPRPMPETAGADPAAVVPTHLLMVNARLTLPLIMAAWGLAVVAVYEGGRTFLRQSSKKSAAQVPAQAEVDKLLNDLLRKAEADRAVAEATTPPPLSATPPPVGAEGPGEAARPAQ